MKNLIKETESWYEDSYKHSGFNAQRRYPNEELLRFMGRNFFSVTIAERKKIRILELGCGSCANLWMISKEGYDAHGIDLSEEAIKLGHHMLTSWGDTLSANLTVQSMTKLEFADN